MQAKWHENVQRNCKHRTTESDGIILAELVTQKLAAGSSSKCVIGKHSREEIDPGYSV